MSLDLGLAILELEGEIRRQVRLIALPQLHQNLNQTTHSILQSIP